MRDVQGALKWMENESKHGGPNWTCLCQSSVRQAYGMPAWAPSAKQAWESVGSKYKTPITRYDDKEWWQSVPAGAILYSTSGTYGHAWMAAGDMSCWTVDYVRRGFIDKADIRLKQWGSYYKSTVGFIDGCQWYTDNQHRFKGLRYDLWDGKIPPYENVKAADDDRTLANAAVWRLSSRLADLGFGGKKWVPVKYSQTYPVKALNEYNALHAPDMADPTVYGPRAHTRIFEKGQ